MAYHLSTFSYKIKVILDTEQWNFSNNKICDGFGAANFFKISVVKAKRCDSVANSQVVSSDLGFFEAIPILGI